MIENLDMVDDDQKVPVLLAELRRQEQEREADDAALAARDAREAALRQLAGELATVLNECANGIQSVPSANAAIDAVLAKALAAGLLDTTKGEKP